VSDATRDGLTVIAVFVVFCGVLTVGALIHPWFDMAILVVGGAAWIGYEVGCGSDEERFNLGLQRYERKHGDD